MPASRPLSILVLGAGGVGGYFGARLAAAGHEVTFLARGAHREAMARDGLRVLASDGELHVEAPGLLGAESEAGPFEVVLACVKLWDLESAARCIEPFLSPDSMVVPFQNGVSALDILTGVLGAERLLGGVAQIAASIERPGVIRQTGGFARLFFGEPDGGRSSRADALLTACQEAGIEARLSESIESRIWMKFIMLAPMAGAACRRRASIGEILAAADGQAELGRLIEETVAVGRAKGVTLPDDVAAKTLAFYGDLPSEMKPSMLHDLEAGKRLEVDWLSGEVVRLGESLGVDTPAHRAVVETLEPVKLGRPG